MSTAGGLGKRVFFFHDDPSYVSISMMVILVGGGWFGEWAARRKALNKEKRMLCTATASFGPRKAYSGVGLGRDVLIYCISVAHDPLAQHAMILVICPKS